MTITAPERDSNKQSWSHFCLHRIATRVTQVFKTPKTLWQEVRNEDPALVNLLRFYVAPLALIPAVSQLIGLSIVGIRMPFLGTVWRAPFFSQLMSSLVYLLLVIAWVPVAARVLEFLAPKFQGKLGFLDASKIVAFSMTPSLVGGALQLVPALSIFSIFFAGYSFYCFGLGIRELSSVPADRRVGFIAVSILSMFFIAVFVGFIVAQFAATPTFMTP